MCVCTVNRGFVERCVRCDPAVSEDSSRRANTALDRIVNLSVRVLNDRLFEHIRVSSSHEHTDAHTSMEIVPYHTHTISTDCWYDLIY